ncbi:DUF2975 domain-containing protein [Alterisphingorhabdus coralli]|uniref:DUF2975 domain-containing protein n=1 Tax=Alterisphingorhabdus coralli TaxID=3071408 RepID=A0AA97F8H6_9SPHN|nr:DUF2975 domain-containing protein [Parasphingorhabdus sp. SCSIO 66989]WOE75928.1 DUF2975 domain-containing protein [Parasphingorhabdus sp. SCSIO 66989]
MSISEHEIIKNDAVLKIARVIIIFAQWVTIFAGIAIVLAIPFLFIFSGPMLEGLAEVFVNKPDILLISAIAGFMAAGVFTLILAYFFIQRLRMIVESVSEGDPFIPVNAVRLRGMGLAILAIQALSFFGQFIFAGVIAAYGGVQASADVDFEINAEIPLQGILLGLLLIVLARVFDHGAAMRSDLEGTV